MNTDRADSVGIWVQISKFQQIKNTYENTRKPSRADELLTRRIQEASLLPDMQLVDHLILSSQGYLSLADQGLL